MSGNRTFISYRPGLQTFNREFIWMSKAAEFPEPVDHLVTGVVGTVKEDEAAAACTGDLAAGGAAFECSLVKLVDHGIADAGSQ